MYITNGYFRTKTVSRCITSPKCFGHGTGVVFLSFFHNVAKKPGSKIASAGVLSKETVE
jgi:hypothetical protein